MLPETTTPDAPTPPSWPPPSPFTEGSSRDTKQAFVSLLLPLINMEEDGQHGGVGVGVGVLWRSSMRRSSSKVLVEVLYKDMMDLLDSGEIGRQFLQCA
jgi:hypothetical protein